MTPYQGVLDGWQRSADIMARMEIGIHLAGAASPVGSCSDTALRSVYSFESLILSNVMLI